MTGDELASVAKAARAAGILVAVDVLHPGRPQDLERLAPLLAQAHWFLPNDAQLLALTGRAELADGMKDVLALGTKGVAVTRGAAGCLIASQDSGAPVNLPAIEVEVVDTTGCGDGFTAGLLAGLLAAPDPAEADPVDAAWLGLACGSLVATGLGSDAGSRTSPRCWTSSSVRSRPWPAGSRSGSHDRAGHRRPAAKGARPSRDPGRDVRPPGGPGT